MQTAREKKSYRITIDFGTEKRTFTEEAADERELDDILKKNYSTYHYKKISIELSEKYRQRALMQTERARKRDIASRRRYEERKKQEKLKEAGQLSLF